MSGPKCGRYRVVSQAELRRRERARQEREAARLEARAQAESLRRQRAQLMRRWAQLEARAMVIEERMSALAASGGVVLTSPVTAAPTGVDQVRWREAISQLEASLVEAEAALELAVTEQRRKNMLEQVRGMSGTTDPDLVLAGTSDEPVARGSTADTPVEDWVVDEIDDLHARAVRLAGSLPDDATEESVAACEQLLERCRSATTPSAATVAVESLRLHIDRERERSERRLANAELVAGLEAMLDDVDDDADQAEAMRERLASLDLDTDLPASLAEDVERVVRAAASRRDDAFVLEQARAALEAIGYDVGEDFTTSTTAGGAVLELPDRDRHGVRIRQRDGQLLFNVVRFDPTGAVDAPDDASAEESFCGDFARFRALLGDNGVEIEMTLAKQPGELPVEVITTAPHRSETSSERVSRSRRLARRKER